MFLHWIDAKSFTSASWCIFPTFLFPSHSALPNLGRPPLHAFLLSSHLPYFFHYFSFFMSLFLSPVPFRSSLITLLYHFFPSFLCHTFSAYPLFCFSPFSTFPSPPPLFSLFQPFLISFLHLSLLPFLPSNPIIPFTSLLSHLFAPSCHLPPYFTWFLLSIHHGPFPSHLSTTSFSKSLHPLMFPSYLFLLSHPSLLCCIPSPPPARLSPLSSPNSPFRQALILSATFRSFFPHISTVFLSLLPDSYTASFLCLLFLLLFSLSPPLYGDKTPVHRKYEKTLRNPLQY